MAAGNELRTTSVWTEQCAEFRRIAGVGGDHGLCRAVSCGSRWRAGVRRMSDTNADAEWQLQRPVDAPVSLVRVAFPESTSLIGADHAHLGRDVRCDQERAQRHYAAFF